MTEHSAHLLHSYHYQVVGLIYTLSFLKIIIFTFLTLGKVKVTSLGTVYSQPSLDITVITTPSEGGLVNNTSSDFL